MNEVEYEEQDVRAALQKVNNLEIKDKKDNYNREWLTLDCIEKVFDSINKKIENISNSSTYISGYLNLNGVIEKETIDKLLTIGSNIHNIVPGVINISSGAINKLVDKGVEYVKEHVKPEDEVLEQDENDEQNLDEVLEHYQEQGKNKTDKIKQKQKDEQPKESEEQEDEVLDLTDKEEEKPQESKEEDKGKQDQTDKEEDKGKQEQTDKEEEKPQDSKEEDKGKQDQTDKEEEKPQESDKPENDGLEQAPDEPPEVPPAPDAPKADAGKVKPRGTVKTGTQTISKTDSFIETLGENPLKLMDGANGQALFDIPFDAKIQILGQGENGWIKIKVGEQEGYVSVDMFLKFLSSPETNFGQNAMGKDILGIGK